MTIEELRKEMAVAMKNRNKVRKNVISSIVQTATNIALNEKIKEPTEMHVLQAIKRELKTKEEQISTCPTSRVDLLNNFLAELEIIKEFMPPLMSETEVYNIIRETVDNVASSGEEISMKLKGVLMKKFTKELNGKADGKTINAVVTKILQNWRNN